ncbi:hypothetical protein [Mesorhizobium sp. L103C131B0]|uniref:hypothetical protein n=1 Tax=Mesorhizobium sp. L103C131B0 TaxID=1287089 RepID=UPI0003CFAC8F|nr:hypothetical protein [Mesorhizobium sp. L103C131B0]ESZ64721.1 hypothetical protein X729_03710 [Mesorhizobium sp. L103C131B0]
MGRVKEMWMEEQQAADDSDYEYWHYLRNYVPNEPAQRYTHSGQQLDELAEDARHLDSYPAFHRMMLVQRVAMVEAYLADRLITLVTNFPDVAKKLVLGHHPLKGQSFPLEAIVANPGLVTEKITSYLKSLMYHELGLVAKLYRVALDVEIFPDPISERVMKDAMVNRHHCVHRDGKDNSGNVLTAIDAAYVAQARESFILMVEHIEQQCDPLIRKLPRYRSA